MYQASLNSLKEEGLVGAATAITNILVAGSNPSLTHNVGSEPKKAVGISLASRISTAA